MGKTLITWQIEQLTMLVDLWLASLLCGKLVYFFLSQLTSVCYWVIVWLVWMYVRVCMCVWVSVFVCCKGGAASSESWFVNLLSCTVPAVASTRAINICCKSRILATDGHRLTRPVKIYWIFNSRSFVFNSCIREMINTMNTMGKPCVYQIKHYRNGRVKTIFSWL